MENQVQMYDDTFELDNSYVRPEGLSERNHEDRDIPANYQSMSKVGNLIDDTKQKVNQIRNKAQQPEKNPNWWERNKGLISNIALNVGGAMQGFAHDASMGRTGRPFSETEAGKRAAHQRDLQTQQQAHQNAMQMQQTGHQQGLETLGVQHEQGLETMGKQQEHATSERMGTQQFTAEQSMKQKEYEAKQAELNRQLQTALQSNDHRQANQILDKQLTHAVEQAGLDREHQAAMVELAAKMTVQQKKELNELLLSYSQDQIDQLARYLKGAEKGLTTADDTLMKARSIADTALVAANTVKAGADIFKPNASAGTSSAPDPYATATQSPPPSDMKVKTEIYKISFPFKKKKHKESSQEDKLNFIRSKNGYN